MKILHTGDWHLGQAFYGYDRSAEQRLFLEQLRTIVLRERPDALLVCGDVFDTRQPSAAAMRLYNDHLLSLRDACPEMTIIVIAGNHDSPSRIEVTSELWQRLNVVVVGAVARGDEGFVDLDRHLVEIHRADGSGARAGYVVAVPYLRGVDYRLTDEEIPDDRHPQLRLVERLLEYARDRAAGLPVVLAMHTAVRADDRTAGHERIGNIEYLSLSDITGPRDYLALGHIHLPHTLVGSDGRARYCGAPLPMSFSEEHDHSVTLVTLDGHQHPEIKALPIACDMPLVTLPTVPTPIDDALEIIKGQPDDRQGYLRANLLTDGYLPGSVREQIVDCLRGKQLRFCEIVATQQHAESDEALPHGFTLEEFKQCAPRQIAEQYFSNKQIALNDRQLQMLEQAIAESQDQQER